MRVCLLSEYRHWIDHNGEARAETNRRQRRVSTATAVKTISIIGVSLRKRLEPRQCEASTNGYDVMMNVCACQDAFISFAYFLNIFIIFVFIIFLGWSNKNPP